MIDRLYIDNFRCFVNFELDLGETAIFLGANGTGKSTVLDVLHKIQELVVRGARVDEVFSARDLSMTRNSSIQHFEIDVSIGGSRYRYELKIAHDPDRKKMRVEEEELWVGGKPLFAFATGKAQLYRDDHSEGPSYPFDWSRSGVGSLYESSANKKLSLFKRELARMIIVKPCPPLFSHDTAGEDEFLEPRMSNFAGWYRYAAQANMGSIAGLFEELKDVLPGFDAISLTKSGTSRFDLVTSFASSDGGVKRTRYLFDQLSDGQRALIALYSLLILPERTDRGISLFIDEPDAYLSLREVQPWIVRVLDACGDALEQAVIVSHHPTAIDHLAATSGVWFSRDRDGPARISDKPEFSDQPLPLSELIARG